MTSDEDHGQPKHRSLRLTHEQHSRSIRRLAVALFTTVAVGLLSLVAYLITHPKVPPEHGPYQKAEELDALIRRDARFTQVRAWCWHPDIEIDGFKQLSPADKSDLERLVSQYAKENTISVRYTSRAINPDNTSEQK